MRNGVSDGVVVAATVEVELALVAMLVVVKVVVVIGAMVTVIAGV